MKTLVMGIDPGFSGAIAVIDLTLVEEAQVFDMPIFTTTNRSGVARKHVDPEALSALIGRFASRLGVCAIEDVFAMPEQGLSSTFRFGYSYGVLRGVLAAHGVTVVPVKPAVWKTVFSLSAKKQDSLMMARSLFPERLADLRRQKDDGRAEALLLAHFGAGLVTSK